MASVTLTISGHGKTWQIGPKPSGTIIGRSSRCDVMLDSKDISREHARILQDPFGRWIVEDLGSSNGVFINGKRIDRRAVLPGEPIIIGSFSLSITQPLDQQIRQDDSISAMTNIIIEDFETEVFYGRRRRDETVSRPCPRQFDELSRHLSELTSPSALYPEVCRFLARAPKTAAVVIRLPAKTKPLPKSPQVLACHFGGSLDDTATASPAAFYPSHLVFRISHRVLEAARSTGDAVMAKSIYSSDEEITTTVVDEHSPRAVMCAPLGDTTAGGDLLYLDIPIDDTTKTTPEETFEFIRAVSQEIVSIRRSLILMQLKAERSILDHELSLAQKIQFRLAPTIPKGLSGIDVAVYYRPVMWVGGDYCDVWSLEDGRLAFAVGDASGNGLSAAMVMSNLHSALRTALAFCRNLSDVIRQVNLHLMESLAEGMPVSLFLGLFDPCKAALQYVNAGHLPPLVVRPQAPVMLLGQQNNSMLGINDIAFRSGIETIPETAQVLVFTDGITKAKSSAGEEFGVKQLMNLLKTAGGCSAERIINLVIEALTNFRQTRAQQDDNTVFALVNLK